MSIPAQNHKLFLSEEIRSILLIKIMHFNDDNYVQSIQKLAITCMSETPAITRGSWYTGGRGVN